MLPLRFGVSAHGATPASDEGWSALALPELALTFTVDGIEGVPESLEAGRYLLKISGDPGPEDYVLGPMFMQLPEGATIEQVMEEAGANPDAPPSIYYTALLAGGVGAVVPAGQTSATSIIDLPPGQWFVAGLSLSRPPVPLTVTGKMPTDLSEPLSNATITLDEMSIALTAGKLVAGENLVKVDNIGAQPHFVEILSVPDGTTRKHVEAAIQAEMNGTPEADALDLGSATPHSYIGEQSAGVVAWASVTLEAGTYAALCFVPDPETGMPHAMSGMHEVFVVS